MQAMDISLSGLDVEWRRLEIIAQNLANVNTAQTKNSTPFRMRSLVTGPRSDFAAHLTAEGTNATAPDFQNLSGVAVLGIDEDKSAPRLVREPGNPNANKGGFVAYPNIDQALQMTMMIKTSRAYEANIVAMNIARQMYSKALELGKNS